jgi:hypothetical protein
MEGNRYQILRRRWEEFSPSKTQAFWACGASVAVAIIVGFAWGGWVTGGTAQAMATSAGNDGRNQLAAAICVERFAAAPDAGVQLAALKDITSTFQQRAFVQEGGWALMPGEDRTNSGAATLCADRLVALELLPMEEATAVQDGATVAQQ